MTLWVPGDVTLKLSERGHRPQAWVPFALSIIPACCLDHPALVLGTRSARLTFPHNVLPCRMMCLHHVMPAPCGYLCPLLSRFHSLQSSVCCMLQQQVKSTEQLRHHADTALPLCITSMNMQAGDCLAEMPRQPTDDHTGEGATLAHAADGSNGSIAGEPSRPNDPGQQAVKV